MEIKSHIEKNRCVIVIEDYDASIEQILTKVLGVIKSENVGLATPKIIETKIPEIFINVDGKNMTVSEVVSTISADELNKIYKRSDDLIKSEIKKELKPMITDLDTEAIISQYPFIFCDEIMSFLSENGYGNSLSTYKEKHPDLREIRKAILS